MADGVRRERAIDATELHRAAIVIDACAPILRNLDFAPLWRQGGATCALATVALHDDSRATTLNAIGRVHAQLRGREDVRLAYGVDDILSAKAEGKLAVIFMFQSCGALEHNIDMVEVFHRLGVRSMNLAYNQAEATADGCMEPRNGGLTSFGRRAIAEMNRLGVLLDLSHTGVRASLEAMEVSTQPVAFTHSNARAIFDHPRNLTDQQIRACAAGRGVIGVNGHPVFVRAGTASPTLDDLLAQVDYLVETAGIDHVGLGLDFSHGPGQQMPMERYTRMLADQLWLPGTLPPPPWTYPLGDARHIGRLSAALVARGWSEGDIRKLLGENFLRLFREVWR